MKIGMFTANFMDHDLESVFKMMAEMGYETAELPAFSDNGHLDIDEVLTGNGAKKIKDLAKNYGPAYAPPPRLRSMVAAGQLGVKTGKGFYEYPRK